MILVDSAAQTTACTSFQVHSHLSELYLLFFAQILRMTKYQCHLRIERGQLDDNPDSLLRHLQISGIGDRHEPWGVPARSSTISDHFPLMNIQRT